MKKIIFGLLSFLTINAFAADFTVDFVPQNNSASISLFTQGSVSFGGGENIIAFSGASSMNNMSFNGSNITFTKPGKYLAIIEARSTVDVWSKLYIKDSSNAIVGQGIWAGSGSSSGPKTLTVMFSIASAGDYKVVLYKAAADNIANPQAIGAPSIPGIDKTIQVNIMKIGE